MANLSGQHSLNINYKEHRLNKSVDSTDPLGLLSRDVKEEGRMIDRYPVEQSWKDI